MTRLVPYCGQELTQTHYESGAYSADPKPRKRLLTKILKLMDDEQVPPRRRVLVAGFLLDRCKREAKREAARGY